MKRKTELLDIIKIDSLFEKNEWVARAEYKEVYNRYCQLTRNLDSEQVELILELSERYFWLSYNDYNSKLIILLKALRENYLTDIHRIIAFPIIKVKDEGKNKSGHSVMYMLGALKTTINEYNDIEYLQYTSFEQFSPEVFSISENDVILLVDDFVGTGTTLSETIETIKEKNDNVTNNNIIVFSIAMQNETYNRLKEEGVNCCVNYMAYKGISEYYQSPILETKIETMRQIENSIPKIKGYRMGYKQSESLITLMKTPNNTFPVFWKNFMKRGVEYKAPFSRF